MTDLYDLTNLTDSTSIIDVVRVANSASSYSPSPLMQGGVLVGGFLIVIFLVIIMIMRQYEFQDNILTAAFACFVLSIFLKYAGLVSTFVVFFFLIIMALDVFFMKLQSE